MSPDQHNHATHDLGYTHGGLRRETGWWGAFVIGLAGTILVTGIAPVMVTSLGASSIPITVFITLTGWLLCLFLAELSAMMPERTGGSPSYAYPAFSSRWPKFAKQINGFTAWAYWLGWFPVAPLNMILASAYLAERFGLNTTAGFTPIHTFIAWSTLVISVIGILLFFIPAYRGIRVGAAFATVLALLSMIPLTFIAVAWIFNPSVVNLQELAGFPHLDGTSFFSSVSGYTWIQVYVAYGFLLTWNVIAMEAAACYVGECANPDHDAKIAMNLEGGYGVFIYTLVPIAFMVVLGAKALSDPNLADPKTIFVTFAGKVFPGVAGEALNWIIAAMLIVALALSALNAIMGSGRALYQLALDGEFPTWFKKINDHGVPARAMAFNVVCSLVVVMAGGAVEIYSFSNVGYTISFIPVLIGYYLLRQDKPHLRRPFKLPEFMKYVALILAAVYFVFWLFGGLWYSKIGNVEIYYWLGWAALLAFLPLYGYRALEDKRAARLSRTAPGQAREPV
ncbi:APC family permease [Methylocella sp.]|uniref:APC family permease n=1 Tax=Methylocella sp. TaxID=1978226 RepID=UPI003C1B28D9